MSGEKYRKSRIDRECHDERCDEGYGYDERDGEDEFSDHPRHEKHRRKYPHDRKGGGNKHLFVVPKNEECRLFRSEFSSSVVLIESRDNHDGVIHEKSEREDECEHREKIERLSKKSHHRKSDEENERYLVLAMANTPKEAERVELARQVHGMYVGKNRMGEAAELMEQQLERVTEEKSKPPLLLLLAQDYVALGRHAEAREVLHRVLENVETSPSNVEKARDLLGQLKQERET